MGVIRVLPPGLVNRIAAGECVERPSSVIKELVENAIDAGATRVEIVVEEGGRALIRVSDDGRGMDIDDMRLSVAPHATSKIAGDDDLFNIHTMGFRGEALASIGAVSRLRITSRTRDSDAAHVLTVDAGDVTGPNPTSGPPGTTVEVRDLFHCVPARRRFLRTNQTEMGHISEQLARIALAHPSVAFSLAHGKRITHQMPATSDPRQRIGDFYGPELSAILLPIHREGGGMRVEGLVAPPAESRGSSKWEYVFVNGRYIRDKFVSHAVKEAYRSLIDPSTYPVAFINISIDPSHVDVNVHPTKIEVRWRDSNFVHGQILAAIRDKFLQSNLDRRLRTPVDDGYRERVRGAMVDFFSHHPNAGASPQTSVVADQAAAERFAVPGGIPLAAAPMDRSVYGPLPDRPATSHLSDGQAFGEIKREFTDAAPEDGNGRPEARPVGEIEPDSHERLSRIPAIQIHNTYLVVQTGEGLMIIDQHALHERILYEQLQQRMSRAPLESQQLLIPHVLRVPSDRLEALEAHADALARLGVDLRPAGPQTVALHGFPTLLERVDPAQFIRDLLDVLSERGARPENDTLLHELLDMMACKAAVKSGDPLTPDEIEALLSRRETAQRSSNCPHGRPTTLHLTLRDLERQFKRR